jgi:nucleotide-binding universal stress UspA family protein
MKRILIPVDGSAKSLAAVRASVAEGPGAIARIDLLNVQPLFNRHIGRWLTRAQREDWRAERSRRALARAKVIVEMSSIPCHAHSAAGAVVPVIAATAKRLRCHEIVVGASRRGLLGRLLANSVSTQLLEVSSLPVRVIPTAPAPLVEALALPAGLSLLALLIFAGD